MALDGDEPTFEAALKQAAAEGIIYARGLPLTADQLRRLIEACPEDHEHSGRRRIRQADFYKASFSGFADFRGAIFNRDADFGVATFSGGDATFDEAIFRGDTNFEGATFSGDASFIGATFEQSRQFGPLVCGRTLFDRAVFEQSVRIELSSRIVSCARVVFRGGADVFVRWADVSLDDVDFAAPSLVAVLPSPPRGEEESLLGLEEPPYRHVPMRAGTWACRLVRDERGRPIRPDDPQDEFAPRVMSLRRAKVAELTLSGVDLRACWFVGAHGLDALRLERPRFARPPAGWHTSPAGWRARWTSRQTVAEEHLWRRQRAERLNLVHPLHGMQWYGDDVRIPGLPETWQAPEAEQIASVYRALRKGREDSKDEPGAADFYYGEMEMRRHSTRNPATRRPTVSIVWLYWLVSGYGLRASRVGDHDRSRRRTFPSVRLRRRQAPRRRHPRVRR